MFTLIADGINSAYQQTGEWPKVSPYQTEFIHDVMEELTSTELQQLSETVLETSFPGCGHHVSSAFEVKTLTPLQVNVPEVKWIMNWINSRAKGSIINFSREENRGKYPRQMSYLRILRTCYFPTLGFNHCQVFRGTLGTLPQILQGSGDQAVVVMWRKTDKQKRVYASVVEKLDFASLDPTQWSIVVFYNRDGTPGRVQNTPQPPSGGGSSSGTSAGPDTPAPPTP